MNVTKIVVIVAAVVGLAWFLSPGKYEKSIPFQGKEFRHAESVDRGELTSYFYTPSGGSPGDADEFIQLVVFDDQASEEYRLAVYEQTKGAFNLKVLDAAGKTYLGSLGGKGERIDIYAKGDEISRVKSIILYVAADEVDGPRAKAKAVEVLTGLQETQYRVTKR